MACVRGGVIGERTRARSYVVEEFVPLYTFAEVSDCHYLIFRLPGFKKEEVMIQVQGSGTVTISGEKRVNDKKYMYFEKNFKVPENCEVIKSVRELEGQVFYVIFPKKVIDKKRSEEGEKQKPGFSDLESNGRRKEDKREKVGAFFWEESVWKRAEKMARQHKVLILTALVAISAMLLGSYRVKPAQFK